VARLVVGESIDEFYFVSRVCYQLSVRGLRV